MDQFLDEHYEHLISIDPKHWKEELLQHDQLFEKMKEKLPVELIAIRTKFEGRLGLTPGV